MEMNEVQSNFVFIQFFAELYKMDLLPVIGIHEFIKKLLLDANEDSILCLCKLLTRVYEPLDQETNKRLPEYLDMLDKLRVQKRFSSRVNSQINEILSLNV